MYTRIHYEGFHYPADQLDRFLLTAGIFTIAVKDSDEIVNHIPEDVEDFREWLLAHNIIDLKRTS